MTLDALRSFIEAAAERTAARSEFSILPKSGTVTQRTDFTTGERAETQTHMEPTELSNLAHLARTKIGPAELLQADLVTVHIDWEARSVNSTFYLQTDGQKRKYFEHAEF